MKANLNSRYVIRLSLRSLVLITMALDTEYSDVSQPETRRRIAAVKRAIRAQVSKQKNALGRRHL
jgi:hypothetical protein